MGGVKFFTVSVETPEADKDLMYAVLSGMNMDVDPEAGELKGGAKELGKLIMSYNKDTLAMLCHVPHAIKEKLSAGDWIAAVMLIMGGKITEIKEVDDGKTIYVEVPADTANDKFGIKMRDEASGVSYATLVKAGLVADEDSDDEFDINECDGMDEMEW